MAVVGRVDMCRCSAGAGKYSSSRDAEGEIVGMLTSGKVPLEKTLVMEKAEVSNRYAPQFGTP